MEIADEEAHLALAYVAAVTDRGYPLKVEEFEAYVEQPRRRRPPSRFASMVGGGAVAYLMASAGRPEPIFDWLVRVKWLDHWEDETVTVSDLGRRVLEMLDEQEVKETPASLRVFTAEDPFAYAAVVGAISATKAELLADPYFRLPQLPHILELTSVNRLLVGPGSDLTELAAAMADIPQDRSLEIRVSGKFHDRFAIPKHGAVENLGTSLNSFGKKVTAMSTMRDPGANEIRRVYRKLWDEATPLDDAVKKNKKSKKTKGS